MLGNAQYDVSDFEEEDMGIPRVMGDATMLPNGDVVLLNGGQVCVGLQPHAARSRCRQHHVLSFGWGVLLAHTTPYGIVSLTDG
jgi:hypothetical protein